MTGPWLGVVADDLSGACDRADAVSEQGASAVVVMRTPGEPPSTCDRVVVVLKSRTAPPQRAVAESLAAARWLVEVGCTKLYQKYCSTIRRHVRAGRSRRRASRRRRRPGSRGGRR